jgi:heme oxygenase
MSSLFALLKSGTERQHREIEAFIDPMKKFGSLDAYKAHLRKTAAFYRPLEENLAALDWSPTGIDFPSRRKTPLLEKDLQVLGVQDSPSGSRPETLARANLDFALGCLYVLEGATLGGQVISRHLTTLGIGPANGGLFFHGYGPRTGEMWKSFQSSATNYCTTGHQMDEAVNGAQWTFENFHQAMI